MPGWRREFQQPRDDVVLARACPGRPGCRGMEKTLQRLETLRASGKRHELSRRVLDAGNKKVLEQGRLAGAWLTVRHTMRTPPARTASRLSSSIRCSASRGRNGPGSDREIRGSAKMGSRAHAAGCDLRRERGVARAVSIPIRSPVVDFVAVGVDRVLTRVRVTVNWQELILLPALNGAD